VFTAFVAYGVSEIQVDSGGRGHAHSQPPPRNEAACSVLRREVSFLVSRARDLRGATERAVERPDAAWQPRRP
jgi:hypothetical protein